MRLAIYLSFALHQGLQQLGVFAKSGCNAEILCSKYGRIPRKSVDRKGMNGRMLVPFVAHRLLAAIGAGEDDVLIDKDIELIARADFKRRLNVKVSIDGSLCNASKGFRKIPSHSIRCGLLRCER